MRAVFVGEGMLELSASVEGWRIGYGGDTLNTAIQLARAGHGTAYLTALGGDALSGRMIDAWRAEGLDTSLVLAHPERLPGIYAIDVDAAGERSFLYWRESSAARAMFDLPAMDAAVASAQEADLLGFSLITLAILPERGRQALLDLANRVRAKGGRVAFDGNYRPRLWNSPSEAREARDLAIATADIGLPTLADEVALGSASFPRYVLAHWQELGCSEVVVKLGPAGCLLPDGRIVAPDRPLVPVDTSGAGDAFNAGYLAARLDGATIEQAARAGHALAGRTIMQPGAIPPRDS